MTTNTTHNRGELPRTLGAWEVAVAGMALVVAASTLVTDFSGFFSLGWAFVAALGFVFLVPHWVRIPSIRRSRPALTQAVERIPIRLGTTAARPSPRTSGPVALNPRKPAKPKNQPDESALPAIS